MILYNSTLMPTAHHGIVASVDTESEIPNWQQHIEQMYIRHYHLVLNELDLEMDVAGALQQQLGIECDHPESGYKLVNALYESIPMSNFLDELEKYWETLQEGSEPEASNLPTEEEFNDWDIFDVINSIARLQEK